MRYQQNIPSRDDKPVSRRPCRAFHLVVDLLLSNSVNRTSPASLHLVVMEPWLGWSKDKSSGFVFASAPGRER